MRYPFVSAAAVLALLALPAWAEVSVTFVNPQQYADAPAPRPRQPSVMEVLKTHLQELGSRVLPANQYLRISIIDIDLAGRYEMW
ncbi:MAG: DUF3016 domain-containing protein [Proteobacteria bacterium]|nr:DUF3016 domain-containing protein [Pseudomonadota bacterium]